VTLAEDEFIEFAEAAAPRLRRAAFLLCGDWHTAEDLTQTALAKVFVSWRRIRRRDAAHSYATRTLVNTFLADRRRKRLAEVLSGDLPDRPVSHQAPELRLVILDALASLPPKARAIVVLRYCVDLPIEQVAGIVGCSPGNVKSQTARALLKLRSQLGDAESDLGSSSTPAARGSRVTDERMRPHG
jgi:RNA polymerase sigma-70 factor (sigma-E family)